MTIALDLFRLYNDTFFDQLRPKEQATFQAYKYKKLEQANRPAFFNDAFRLAQKKVYFSPEVIFFFLTMPMMLIICPIKRRYAEYCDEVYTKVMGLALKMSIEGRARLKRVRQLKTSCR